MTYLQAPLADKMTELRRKHNDLQSLAPSELSWLFDVATERVCDATTERNGDTVRCTLYAYAHAHPDLRRHSGVDSRGVPWAWPVKDGTS